MTTAPETPAPRDAPLEMSPDEFRRAGHRLVDQLADFLGGLRAAPVTRPATPSSIRALLPTDTLPEEGTDPGALLEETWDLLARNSLFNGHPRFFGYISSSAAPIGALADLMAATINANVGGWQLSPVASEIEGQTVRWIAQLLGIPCEHGLLVSGGNVANLVGFLAARCARGPESLRERGIHAGSAEMTAYVSAETHTWIQKAADLSGLGTAAIRWIPVNEHQQIDVDALRTAIEEDRDAGRKPFLLVGNAGTVGTGAVDPLDRLAEVARDFGLWFHVDGAYGAFARVVPELADRFSGIDAADSVAVDPHKWLYAPMEAGCLLVRDPDVLQRTFSYTPSYYRFTGEDEPRTNYYEIGLQNSRGFRALKVWLGLRQVGRAGYEQMIGDDVRLAEALQHAVADHPELEAGPSGLSITTFRYVPGVRPDPEELNTLNEEILTRIKGEGEAFLSNAVIAGQFLLRACVCNFRTTLEDILALPELVARHGRVLSE